ncbi:hypothetical protein POVWA2_050280 [Plasmodium ovale wallikeri]|uniref:HTH OST-type domain-containing protein n=2 Tax=Plasmodium ovale TaxID=36330 RepID=A0A1A8ZNX1_PLAOA|nr:hypothetical protein POVWA1_001120 [Plasmodium ovale wallikeri]SBT45586.1 hypothetical protein POVWA2_050280 [Plasmodium ovale wallikeri]SBT78773.1 conserved Plasmodium protein, unknown function [Plasmodium ovale]
MGYSAKNMKERNNKKRNINYNHANAHKLLKENRFNHDGNVSTATYNEDVIRRDIYYTHDDAPFTGKITHFEKRLDMNTTHLFNYNENLHILNRISPNEAKIKKGDSYFYYEPLRYPAFKISDKIKDEKGLHTKGKEIDLNYHPKVFPGESHSSDSLTSCGKKILAEGDNYNICTTQDNIPARSSLLSRKNGNSRRDAVQEENEKEEKEEGTLNEARKTEKGVNKYKIEKYTNANRKYIPHSHVQNSTANLGEDAIPMDNIWESKNEKDDCLTELGVMCMGDTMQIEHPEGHFLGVVSRRNDKRNDNMKEFLTTLYDKHLINPNEITNEIKFILHMTILTLYKDQLIPTYGTIKNRLACFNEKNNILCNFLSIYTSLYKEYIVVKSKEKNIFVLLRETPKWFCGWIKTKSFSNTYSKKVWTKLIEHLLTMCRTDATHSYVFFLINFVIRLHEKGHLFFSSPEGDNTLLGVLLPDSFRNVTVNEECAQKRSTNFVPFNLYHSNFSYFSHLSPSNVYSAKSVQGKIMYWYRQFLSQMSEENNLNGTPPSSSPYVSFPSNDEEKSGTELCAPYEFTNDIYEVAKMFKRKDLSFFEGYSVGKIAHIIQLSLYSGLMHEEEQLIKPSCCSRTLVPSVFYLAPGNGVSFHSEVATVGSETPHVCNGVDPFLEMYESYKRDTEESLFLDSDYGGENRSSWIPVSIANLQEAKEKTSDLVSSSLEKGIILCSFRDKFVRTYGRVINPLHFGYSSLIEFLFFGCNDICRIYILNNHLILVHPNFEIRYVKYMEEKKKLTEAFIYSDYCYDRSEKEKRKFKNLSLELCTIMRDLARRKSSFMITFFFWKYMNNGAISDHEYVSFLESATFLLPPYRGHKNGKENVAYPTDNVKTPISASPFAHFVRGTNMFSLPSLVKSGEGYFDLFDLI